MYSDTNEEHKENEATDGIQTESDLNQILQSIKDENLRKKLVAVVKQEQHRDTTTDSHDHEDHERCYRLCRFTVSKCEILIVPVWT